MKYMKLSDVVIFVKNGASIKQNKENNEGHPITRIETLSNGIFNFNKLGHASIFDDRYSDFYLKDGDVLLSHINSEKFIGRSVVFHNRNKEPIIHGMNLLNIRFNKNLYIPEFFAFYTKSSLAKAYFKENTKHAVNQASITSTAIKSMLIPDINITEQAAISSVFMTIEKSINIKRSQLSLLDELVKSRFIRQEVAA